MPVSGPIIASKMKRLIFEESRKGISESFLGERPSGGALQVCFKIEGFSAVCKCNGCFHSSRPVFGGVEIISLIMRCQTRLEIFGETHIESIAVRSGLKYVGVKKFHRISKIYGGVV